MVMRLTRPQLKITSLRPSTRRWKGHLAELALLVGLYVVYLLTRGLVVTGPGQPGLDNAQRIISLQRASGFLWEPGWQAWALAHAQALVIALNWVYIITYWPVLLGVGLALYIRNRPRFNYYRTVVVISLAAALGTFIFFPVAPPFRASAHLVDTIQLFGPSQYGSPAMAVYYNTNAAMPSLHFCWTVVLGVLAMRTLGGWLRLFGLFYPAMTFFAITITGNHFILDAVAGGVLAGLSFGIMELGKRRRSIVLRAG